ncbi:YesL family protein [Enterococcus sp. JM9B]|uniref:YesL family protein n=1 Tax=Enterococcus sp. JM9B TaxID=1857216 RepID=UPI00137531B9|nr:DUF624 domain-containing protein [Enterococcus sp. JM9B]KAF1303197.1 hypothetical protein BAU16_05350 [Enterococcus sp. JM9B]
MQQPKGIFKLTYSFGELLLAFIKLHFFWSYFTLCGGIVLGIFPATATLIHIFQYLFENKEFPSYLFQWYKEDYQKNFRSVNQLGLIQLLILAVLWIDLRVVSNFLQNQVIHLGLIVLFALALLVSLYLFPAFLRYDMCLIQYFKQAFFLTISNFIESLAMIIGILLVTALATFLPILTLVAFIPLLVLPVSWFSLQAMLKIERNNLPEK